MDDERSEATELNYSDPAVLEIEWADGHRSRFEARHLRALCRCAHCLEFVRAGKPIPVPEVISIRDVRLVGSYGVAFTFSDGHEYGIYRWDYLRERCPCPECSE